MPAFGYGMPGLGYGMSARIGCLDVDFRKKKFFRLRSGKSPLRGLIKMPFLL